MWAERSSGNEVLSAPVVSAFTIIALRIRGLVAASLFPGFLYSYQLNGVEIHGFRDSAKVLSSGNEPSGLDPVEE